MTGLYIHIPFCAQKCAYCDFCSHVPKPSEMEAYVAQLEQRMAQWDGTRFDTVYIGGGTPSLLPLLLWQKLFDALHRHFVFSNLQEWTVEGNPDSISQKWIETIKDGGATRVSMGVQAVQPQLLRLLGRIHTFEQAVCAAKWVRDSGLHLNIDLMTGLPQQTSLPRQTIADWRETLERGMALQPDHISCYTLQLEDNTPLARQVQNGLLLPDDDETAEMMELAVAMLQPQWPRYEISNFAQSRQQSLHNLIYWHNEDYLGLGTEAHSSMRIQGRRYRWIDGEERRLVSAQDDAWDTLMLGLRLIEGISTAEFAARHGIDLQSRLGDEWQKLCAWGLATDNGRWQLTQKGLALQNSVLTRLLTAWER